MKSMVQLISRISVVVLLLLAFGVTADACPTCKDTLGENDVRMVSGYFWSIVFMMSMPFVLLGSLGGYFYFQIRSARVQAGSQFAGAMHS